MHTLDVGFQGDAMSSADNFENFSASSFTLKHLNLAPENFLTACKANFLSVNTRVCSAKYKKKLMNYI